MQRTVANSKKKIGKKYRSVKVRKLKRAHRETLKAQRRKR